MFRTALTSMALTGRAKDHAALVAEQLQDERAIEAAVVESQRDVGRDDERYAQLRASLDEVGAHRYRLQLARSQLTQAYDRRCADRERQLRALADPRIEAFLDWLQAEVAGLNRKLVTYEVRGGRDARTGQAFPPSTGSNGAAIHTIAHAHGEARLRAEALKFVTVPDVDAAIEEIRRAIPSVDQAEQRVRQEVA